MFKRSSKSATEENSIMEKLIKETVLPISEGYARQPTIS